MSRDPIRLYLEEARRQHNRMVLRRVAWLVGSVVFGVIFWAMLAYVLVTL